MNVETLLSRRGLYLAGFLAPLALIATGILYFQRYLQLDPCPLCVVQRGFLLAVAAVCLVAFVHNARGWGSRLYGVGAALCALGGASVAARHVYIQNLPPERVPDCGPGLDYMLDNFPISEVVEEVLRGSGNCAEVLWSFLGLSIPGWTLVAFLVMAGAGLYQALRRAD